MKKRKLITNKIYKKLKELDRSTATDMKKQDDLKKFLQDIYGTPGELSVQDMIDRKVYLQSMLDSQNYILSTIGLAIIVWLALEGGKQLGLSLVGNSSFHDFFAILIAPFWALLICWPASHWLARTDTKYRKYNLIDFELEIIDSILEKELHYEQIKDDIIKSRFQQTMTLLEEKEAAMLPGGKESTEKEMAAIAEK